jgi:hypothetical protein
MVRCAVCGGARPGDGRGGVAVSFRTFCCANEELVDLLRVLTREELPADVVMVPGIDTPRPAVDSFDGRAGMVLDPHRAREETAAGEVILEDESCGDGVSLVILEAGESGVVDWGMGGVWGRVDSAPFELLRLLSFLAARTVESDEVDVVDSRTGSNPISLITLTMLPVLFLVTGGRLGLELIVRSIAAGPGEWDEADVGVEE